MSKVEFTLEEKLKDINVHLDIVTKMLKKYKDVPDCKIRVRSTGAGISQYYYKSQDNEYIYIPATDRDFAKRLIQKEYYKHVYDELIQQKRVIERFMNGFKMDAVESVYQRACKGRQKLLEPIIPSNEQFIEEWMKQHPAMQNPYPYNMSIKTERGEIVRSKSEKIIADTFYKYGIPYVYEPAFRMENGFVTYPDFVTLNLRERKTKYWEHLGLGDDSSYTQKNIDKICWYEKSGLRLGDDLIISVESNRVPLDVSVIEEKIVNHLL